LLARCSTKEPGTLALGTSYLKSNIKYLLASENEQLTIVNQTEKFLEMITCTTVELSASEPMLYRERFYQFQEGLV